MIQPTNQDITYFTWRAIFWRVLVTLLLLFFLAGFGLTIFNSATTQPDTHVLPTFTYEAGINNP
jgi:hypothetical protein